MKVYFGNKDKADMLLRPQFWEGQQHGGKSAEIHARHLRPLCEMVPSGQYHKHHPNQKTLYRVFPAECHLYTTDPTEADTAPTNMVLFVSPTPPHPFSNLIVTDHCEDALSALGEGPSKRGRFSIP